MDGWNGYTYVDLSPFELILLEQRQHVLGLGESRNDDVDWRGIIVAYL